MKKILVISLMVLVSFGTLACGICGCSAHNTSLGMLPGAHSNFIGLRYDLRHYNSNHPPLLGPTENLEATNYFHTTQLWGRYTLFNRLELYGFIPYNYYHQLEGNSITTNHGLGDVSLIASGLILTPKENIGWADFSQQWTMGVGVKAPTGESRIIDSEMQMVLPNMQPGTGSWDFSAVTNYQFVKSGWGLNLDASYRYNLANKYRYKFGNRLLAGITGFKQLDVSDEFSIVPQIGVEYEVASKDYNNLSRNEINDYSGGYFFNGQATVNVIIKNFDFNVGASLPIAQNYGQGYVKSSYMLTAGLKYIFTKN